MGGERKYFPSSSPFPICEVIEAEEGGKGEIFEREEEEAFFLLYYTVHTTILLAPFSLDLNRTCFVIQYSGIRILASLWSQQI